MYYNFKKVFLDLQYEDSFLSLCQREKLITKYKSGLELSPNSVMKYTKYKQRVLCYLALFETLDFSRGLIDLSPLVNRGIINEDSNCNSDKTIKYDKEFVEQADTMLLYGKKDVVSRVTSDYLQDLKEYKKSHPGWGDKVKKIWLGVANGNGGLSFNKDYESIIKNFDSLFDYNFDTDYGNVYDDIICIRNSLIQGLYSSMTTDAVYASSIFQLHSSKPTPQLVDDIYYLVETKLPDEANVLPMPSTIDEALRMKESSELKSFRSVMSEWCYYYSNNEFGLAEKIHKDIVKANKQFENLERFRKFASSPYTQVVCLLGGCLPYPAIAHPVAFTGFISPFLAHGLQQKYTWALMTKKRPK